MPDPQELPDNEPGVAFSRLATRPRTEACLLEIMLTNVPQKLTLKEILKSSRRVRAVVSFFIKYLVSQGDHFKGQHFFGCANLAY